MKLDRRNFLFFGAGALASRALGELKVFTTGIENESVLKVTPLEIDLGIGVWHNHFVTNLNFPIQLNHTFIDCLNSHIFLYIQLELYYFISLLSIKISELKEDVKDKENKN